MYNIISIRSNICSLLTTGSVQDCWIEGGKRFESNIAHYNIVYLLSKITTTTIKKIVSINQMQKLAIKRILDRNNIGSINSLVQIKRNNKRTNAI